MIFERPQDCQDCELCKTRTRVVQSVLPEGVEVVFIAEAPGAEEDKQGIPLIGQAGRLFNSILEEDEIPYRVFSIRKRIGKRQQKTFWNVSYSD